MTPEESPIDSGPRAGYATALGLCAIAVLLVPGLSLVGTAPHVPDESWRRPLALALLGCGLFALSLSSRRPSGRGIVLALLALGPAIAAALHPNASAYEASSAPVFVALSATILLGSTIGGGKGPARVLDALGAAGLASASWVIVDALLGRAAVGPFGRSGVAGPALAALLVPAAWLGRCVPSTRGARRAFRALPALLVVAALVLTRSRTGWVAGAAGVSAATIRLLPSRRTKLAIGALALVALVTGFLAFRGVLPGGDTLRVRLGLARASVALVNQSPWLGHGPDGFARDVLPVRDPEEARLSLGGRPLAAHDDFLHVAAENGVLAALAIGLLVMLALRTAVGRGTPRESLPSPLAAIGLAILVATVVSALAENPLLSIASSLPFGLVAGLASCPAIPAPLRRRRRVGSAALYLGAATLVWFAFATYAVPLGGDRVLANWLLEHGTEALDPETRPAANARLRAEANEYRGDVHPALLYRIATGLASEGRLDDAWKAFDRLLVVDPGATEARLDTAELYRADGRDDDAKAILRRARDLDPTRFDVPLRLGHLTLGDEPLPGQAGAPADPIAVLRFYLDAIALAPSRFEGPAALARFHRRMGDLPSARREIARAKELGGLRGEVLLESFRLAEAERTPAAATLAILALALAASPSLAGEVDREATRLLDAGDAEERRALEAAAAAKSGADMARADALYDAAIVRRSALFTAGLMTRSAFRIEAAADATRGKHRRAVAIYRAILSDPFAIEDPRTALAASSSAARFDAALSEALSARGRTLQGYEELGANDLPAAERDFRAALKKSPDLAAAHYGLARALARAGNDVEAAEELTRAVTLAPEAWTRAADEPDLARVRGGVAPPAPK